MAKKVVASLKDGSSKKMTKVVKMVKSPKTGAYILEEKDECRRSRCLFEKINIISAKEI